MAVSHTKSNENNIFEMCLVAAATNKPIFRELASESNDNNSLALCLPAPSSRHMLDRMFAGRKAYANHKTNAEKHSYRLHNCHSSSLFHNTMADESVDFTVKQS